MVQTNTPACWAPSSDSDRVMMGLSKVFRELRGISDNAGMDVGAAAVLIKVALHPDGIRISDLAEVVRLDLSTISRHVRALEESGYLARKPDPQDRRASLVSLTDAGGETSRALMQARADLFARTCADWPEDDTRALADLLDRLADGLTTAIHPQGANA